MQGKFTVVLGVAGAFLLLGCALDGGDRPEDTAVYKSGKYTASAESVGGPLWVTVSFTAQAIVSVTVIDHKDSVDREEVVRALETIPGRIVAAQSPEVVWVTGATITSRRIMNAVEDCIAQAKK